MSYKSCTFPSCLNTRNEFRGVFYFFEHVFMYANVGHLKVKDPIHK